MRACSASERRAQAADFTVFMHLFNAADPDREASLLALLFATLGKLADIRSAAR